MLGNFVSESGLIPDLHQYGGGPGYGLAQWPFNSVVNCVVIMDMIIVLCKDNVHILNIK